MTVAAASGTRLTAPSVPVRAPGASRRRGSLAYDRARDAWTAHGIGEAGAVPPSRSLRARRGLTVAILGPDGAGKTTLADGLRDALPLQSAYVYLGIWRQNRLEQRLQRVFGAQLAMRLVKLLGKSLAIERHRRRGRLVILDRYTCDAELPGSTDDVWGRISARLTTRTCRTPDLILLLDAPVELMYARKGEHGLQELQQRRDAYLAMRDRFPQMEVVDVSVPPEEVRRAATELIWRRWSAAQVARSR